MIQTIETFETIDRFVKQTLHTLYLKLKFVNAKGCVHFAEKAGKAGHFLRQLLHVPLHGYLLLPQSKLSAGKIQHYERCSNKKAKKTTNFVQVNTVVYL